MAIYKVHYVGFAYVEADDETEAEEVYWDGGSFFEEGKVTNIEFVSDVDRITFEDSCEE